MILISVRRTVAPTQEEVEVVSNLTSEATLLSFAFTKTAELGIMSAEMRTVAAVLILLTRFATAQTPAGADGPSSPW
jgi:hypothetical protein